MKFLVLLSAFTISANVSLANELRYGSFADRPQDLKSQDMMNRAYLATLGSSARYDLSVSATCTLESLTLNGKDKKFELIVDGNKGLVAPVQLRPYLKGLNKVHKKCIDSSKGTIAVSNTDIGQVMEALSFESHFLDHSKTGYKSRSYGSSKIPGSSGCSAAKELAGESALEKCYQDGNTECIIVEEKKIFSTPATASFVNVTKGYCEYESTAKSID